MMKEEGKIPMMLQLWFGEAAESAQGGASERMVRWCEGFEEWLADLTRRYKPSSRKQAVLAWRRLAKQCRKMPWELTKYDIEQHVAWMRAEGYAETTIYNSLGIMASFFRWCNERGIEAEAGSDFNPAAEVERPKIKRYAGARLLKRGEVETLLEVLLQDTSALGLRERAFILTRLRVGVPLRSIQQLKWGQIEVDKSGAWVRWRAGEGRVQLPMEVWEAILAYLRASRRLEGMQDERYVFAPLINLFGGSAGEAAEDWAEGRYISSSELLSNVKLYGRLAKIPEEKLTLMTLQRTAIRLRLDEGGSLEEMKVFLDSQEGKRFTKYRLGKLPQLPGGEDGERETDTRAVVVPVRKGKPFKPGDGLRHGLYAHSLPAQEIAEIAAEGKRGVEDEIVGLRTLARRLMERQTQTTIRKELVDLMEAYTRAAHWLGELLKAEKQLTEQADEEDWGESLLAALQEAAEERGEVFDMEAIRAEATGEEAELKATVRQLAEEVASTRLVLRRTFRLAMESTEVREQVRLTDLYGSGCVRLSKLLKATESGKGKLEAYLNQNIDEAIDAVTKEWGFESD